MTLFPREGSAWAPPIPPPTPPPPPREKPCGEAEDQGEAVRAPVGGRAAPAASTVPWRSKPGEVQ